MLTGVNITGGTVVATDTILQGFGKLQNQINALIGGSIYQGVWNAATNTPTLTSGVGTDGYYYITNVAGNTNLDGITDWHVGDWAIFHGGTWQQVDNTDAVVSVNGYTGAVSLVSSDIAEGLTNLYFTNTRARQSLSLTTTGTSGAATYDDATGVFNIPQYQSVLTNPITGSGTVNYVPKFDTTSSIANSNIQDSGSLITLGSDTYINGNLGIGTSSLTGRNLLVSANITGATLSVGVTSNGTVQSDVTNARAFSTGVSVAASSTLLNLFHYTATQGTIGAGATIDTQMGFYAINTLVGATNNYGFYGAIPASTGDWNLYMAGTANNYLAGNLGIGTTDLTQSNLRVSKNITGNVISYGIASDGVIQNDVTNQAHYFYSSAQTAASSFTLNSLFHFRAQEGTIGAGSSITNQYGYFASSTIVGATNNYAFYGAIPNGTNRWNLYMDGSANNYLAGALGIGVVSLTGYSLRINKNITGATSSYGMLISGEIQSDVTSNVYYNRTISSTNAASFTLNNLYHNLVSQGTFGAGSTVTNQYGFIVNSSLTGATNNYAFTGQLAAATNTWNLYNSGTASNYMAGSLGIGTTALTGYNLKVLKNITGSAIGYGVSSEGVIQSDVTTQSVYFASNASTAAASFTVPIIAHFSAVQGTFGAGSSVTTQYGYFVSSSMTGATNNHAFRGGLTSGTGRWNIYMDGDAENYILGNVGIGVSASRVSSGPILTSTLTNGGSGYVDGTYTDVAVTAISSNGAGALYTIVVSGGVVTTATLTWAGTSYKVGNTITVSNTLLGGTGSGLIITIDTVDSSPLKVSSTIGGDITLYRSDTSLSAGENYGTIKWEGNDATVKASGLQAEIGAFAAGTSGGANLSFFTRSSVAGTSLVENLRITDLGNIGIGATSGLTQYNVRASKNITGATIAYGITSDGITQSGVTSQSHYYSTNAQTQATTFTLNSLFHYRAIQGTLGAGSTINNQFGFYVDNTLTGATNNYGFHGNIASATNAWNLYMVGTANNYMAGSLGIGATSLTGHNLRLSKSITGATTAYALRQDGVVQSGVTSEGFGIYNLLSTQATAFTLTSYYHFTSADTTLGAGSAVTNQLGFYATNLTGATNNYGFYGSLIAGTNKWNIYMAGTAQNYLAGALSIGVTTANASALLQVDSTTKGFLPPRMTAAQRTAIGTPAVGLMVYQTDGTEGVYVNTSIGWKSLTMV